MHGRDSRHPNLAGCCSGTLRINPPQSGTDRRPTTNLAALVAVAAWPAARHRSVETRPSQSFASHIFRGVDPDMMIRPQSAAHTHRTRWPFEHLDWQSVVGRAGWL